MSALGQKQPFRCRQPAIVPDFLLRGLMDSEILDRCGIPACTARGRDAAIIECLGYRAISAHELAAFALLHQRWSS